MRLASHTWLYADAAALGHITYVGDTVGSDPLYVGATDGHTWSDNAAFTATTVSAASVNHVPVVTAHDVTVDTGTPVALSSLFTANDPDGDSITQYRFLDDGSSGHFEKDGVILASHTWQQVDAAELGKIN